MNATCPTTKELRSLSLGQLPEEQSDNLILHLRQCETCQMEMESLDDSDDTFVEQLKSVSSDSQNEFLGEDDCRIASARALAALASAETEYGTTMDRIPKTIGEYEIIRPIGRGGMGQVYLGRHTKLGRKVAVKVIANHRRWDERTQKRFASEMKNIGRLNHPNIVTAHDAREVDGLAVLVTEFVDGMDVSEILKRSEQLSIADACKITESVCKALEYIDSQGLVHRDIKPSNIMIDQTGTVKLLDLGLARLQSIQQDGVDEFTATGQAVGTADYVSPEQINQIPNLDTRTDIYGLGCTLYKLLSGRAPFAGAEYPTAFAKMNAHVDQVPVSIGNHRSDLPKDLVKLIDQMLLKKPEQRPQSAKEVVERIEKLSGKLSAEEDLKTLVQESLVKPSVGASSPGADFPNESPSKTAFKETNAGLFNRNPWAAAIAAGAAALALGIWLGITITVKKPDGSISKVVIPDGSTAVIDQAGNIEVHLAGGNGSVRIDRSNVQENSVAKDEMGVPLFEDSDPGHPWKSAIVKRRVGGQQQHRKGIALELKPSSPLYGVVRAGDRIDVIAVPDELSSRIALSDSWPRLIEGNVKVDRVEESGGPNESQTIVFDATNGIFESAIEKAKREWAAIDPDSDGVRIQLAFQRSQRKEEMLYSRFHGLWRTVLVTGADREESDRELKNFLHLFHHDRLAIFPGHVEQNILIEYELVLTSNDRIQLCDTSREQSDPSDIKILDEDLFEISFGPRTVRLQRVEVAKTPNEKAVLQMVADRKFDREFSIQIATPEKVDEFGEDQKLIHVEKEPYWFGPDIVTNEDLISAEAEKTDGGWGIRFELSPIAGQKMAYMTKRHRGGLMKIEIKGEPVLLPKITDTVYRSGLIPLGDLNEEQAKEMAQAILGSFSGEKDDGTDGAYEDDPNASEGQTRE